MPQEYSAGAIVFHHFADTIKYLLLRHINENTGQPGHWDFAKGHVEPNENPKQAAFRETQEETGLKELNFINGFQDKNEYFFKRKNSQGQYETIHKEVIYYLIESKTNQITLSHEHCDFAWLPLDEALERLTHNSSKEILKKAEDKLKSEEPFARMVQ